MEIHKIKEESAKRIHELIENSNFIQDIEGLGYSIVIFESLRIGIINYKIEKEDEDKYYGFEISKGKGLLKMRDDVSLEHETQINSIILKHEDFRNERT